MSHSITTANSAPFLLNSAKLADGSFCVSVSVCVCVRKRSHFLLVSSRPKLNCRTNDNGGVCVIPLAFPSLLEAEVCSVRVLSRCSKRRFQIPCLVSLLLDAQHQVNLSSEDLIGVQFWMVVVGRSNQTIGGFGWVLSSS